MGVKPDDMVVGFAGRLTPNKGINELVAAMASIVHLNPSLKLVLAGELDNTDPLAETDLQKMEQPWVLKLGKVTNMPEFYAALDIFCLPSHREGFPNVNLEAAATGLPIVTTSATGCVDSVRQGVDGVIVPPQDTNELAHAIETLLRDPRLRHAYGEQGRERAIKLFDERVMNDLFMNTINDLYESSKHSRKSKRRKVRLGP
jgi:glycosyltransferase involved in cell wall biosynthesis